MNEFKGIYQTKRCGASGFVVYEYEGATCGGCGKDFPSRAYFFQGSFEDVQAYHPGVALIHYTPGLGEQSIHVRDMRMDWTCKPCSAVLDLENYEHEMETLVDPFGAYA